MDQEGGLPAFIAALFYCRIVFAAPCYFGSPNPYLNFGQPRSARCSAHAAR